MFIKCLCPSQTDKSELSWIESHHEAAERLQPAALTRSSYRYRSFHEITLVSAARLKVANNENQWHFKFAIRMASSSSTRGRKKNKGWKKKQRSADRKTFSKSSVEKWPFFIFCSLYVDPTFITPTLVKCCWDGIIMGLGWFSGTDAGGLFKSRKKWFNEKL